MRRWRAARNRPRQARPKGSSGRRQKALAAFVGNLGDAASRGQVPRRLHARGSLFRLSRAPSFRRRNASGVESRPGSKHVEVAHDHLRPWLCTRQLFQFRSKYLLQRMQCCRLSLGTGMRRREFYEVRRRHRGGPAACGARAAAGAEQLLSLSHIESRPWTPELAINYPRRKIGAN
jgi:hypothetical protein